MVIKCFIDALLVLDYTVRLLDSECTQRLIYQLIIWFIFQAQPLSMNDGSLRQPIAYAGRYSFLCFFPFLLEFSYFDF